MIVSDIISKKILLYQTKFIFIFAGSCTHLAWPQVTNYIYSVPQVRKYIYSVPQVRNYIYSVPQVTKYIYSVPQVRNYIYSVPQVRKYIYSVPQVDEDEYLELLPERTQLMLLARDQLWSPTLTMQGSVSTSSQPCRGQ
jgi:hypothetical protein